MEMAVEFIILFYTAGLILGLGTIAPALLLHCWVYNPRYIYENSPLSVKGAITVAILMNLAFPVYAIIYWGIYLSFKNKED